VREEQTKVLSDYAGITIALYRKRDDGNLVAAVGTACNRIRRAIEEEQKQPEIGVLPSTALAVGYFENFVTKVVPALCDKRELAMKRKDKLSEITKESLQSNVRTLVQIAIETPFRDFPFYIRAKDYNRKPKRALSAFDIPTTLLASHNAIELILGGRSVGLTTDQEQLEQREIRNFARPLGLLIAKQYGKDTSCVKIDNMEYLKSV
jgi:hypothetical protein